VASEGSIHPKTQQPYKAIDESPVAVLPDALLEALLYLKGEARVCTVRAKQTIEAGQTPGEGEGRLRHLGFLQYSLD
jgi:hypothetical protein